MGNTNLPDNWGDYYETCQRCEGKYHRTEGDCTTERKCVDCECAYDCVEGSEIRRGCCADCGNDSSEICTYELSDNQDRFVNDAFNQGLDVRFDYSGRGMHGTTCPSVTVSGAGEFNTSAVVSQDSMGLGVVVYARS